MAKWQRDTWEPKKAVASVNGVMPSDVQYMLPAGTIPQVDQSMPDLPSLSFPQGGSAPAALPVIGIRSRSQPAARKTAAPVKQRTTTPQQEKAGEDRVLPGMARGRGRIDAPSGDGLAMQRGERERIAGALDAERAPVEEVRRMPTEKRGGGQERTESSKRVYLPKPQLITGSLIDDAIATGSEDFIAPGAMPGMGELMQILPMLMMMQQGGGMPPMGAPPMGGQEMPMMPEQWQERGW